MAKWCGVIGYANSVETSPGIWENQVIEKRYCGDLLANTTRWQSSDSANDDINISHQISIVADQFASQDAHLIKYAEYMGVYWEVVSFEFKYPRLNLWLGGLYNG